MPTYYSVSGKSRTKPADLPEGLKVEEKTEAVSVRVPCAGAADYRIEVKESGGENVSFKHWHPDASRQAFSQLSVSHENARRLRDALNEILGDGAAGANRVFKDTDGDLWFEVEPNMFEFDHSWSKALISYTRYVTTRSYEHLSSDYNPLTDVTSSHPRPGTNSTRVFKDGSSLWFEVESGWFIEASDWADALNGRDAYEHNRSGYGRLWPEVPDYKTDVTHLHPRPTD